MEECGDPMRLVDELLSRFGSAECCVAHELCDRYDPSAGHDYILLSGMAIGHEDRSAPENTIVSNRVPADEFTQWHS